MPRYGSLPLSPSVYLRPWASPGRGWGGRAVWRQILASCVHTNVALKTGASGAGPGGCECRKVLWWHWILQFILLTGLIHTIPTQGLTSAPHLGLVQAKAICTFLWVENAAPRADHRKTDSSIFFNLPPMSLESIQWTPTSLLQKKEME